MPYVGLAHPVIKPTTGAGIVLGKAVDTDIDPQYSEASQYGDNTKAYYRKTFKSSKIKLGVTELPIAAHNAIFGHTVDSSAEGGAEIEYKAADTANYVGVGIYTEEEAEATTYVAMWMPRVKFSDPKDQFETSGDTVTYKTASIEGEALADSTGLWKKVKKFSTESAAVTWLNTQAGVSTT